MCRITDKIVRIIDKIPEDAEIPSIFDFRVEENGKIRYKLKTKSTYAAATSLLHHEKASIALIRIPDKGEFPLHNHKAPVLYEILIILDGKLRLTVNDVTSDLSEFEMIKIDRNVKHSALAIGDVLLIAITIPRDEGFPI